MKKLILVCLVALCSLPAFSQSAWEITWDFYGIRHQGLMMLDDDNTGFFRVNCYNLYYGNLIDVVDQDVIARSVYDGVVLNCYNPRSAYSTMYSADNFKIFQNGAMYMMDDSGNWSTMITMSEVRLSNLNRMLIKYGLK